MKIREFLDTDQAAVISLWNECALVVPWNDPGEDIERKLKVNRDLFLVGHDDELVATVMGGYEGHRGWINYLAVKPSSRRKGHGQEIMQAVEDRIRSQGCPKTNLQIRAGNAGVAAFYEAIGYGTDDVIGMGNRL